VLARCAAASSFTSGVSLSASVLSWSGEDTGSPSNAGVSPPTAVVDSSSSIIIAVRDGSRRSVVTRWSSRISVGRPDALATGVASTSFLARSRYSSSLTAGAYGTVSPASSPKPE